MRINHPGRMHVGNIVKVVNLPSDKGEEKNQKLGANFQAYYAEKYVDYAENTLDYAEI